MHNKLLSTASDKLGLQPHFSHNTDEHDRYHFTNTNYRTILIKNIPFLFTCDETNKLVYKQDHAIIIKDGIITDVLPSSSVPHVTFDVIYDAGKRGGIVITPGLINVHSHIHMYLLRSAMMLDEEATVDETIAAMAVWQRNDTEESYTYASIGDITEQQKYGITTTLTHGPSFWATEIAARISHHNLVNDVSAVSNSRPENSPDMVERLLERRNDLHSTPAVALHYLWKTPKKTLRTIKKLITKHDVLLTFHMAESAAVVEETLKKHAMSETELLAHTGLLDHRAIASHAIHIKDRDIRKLTDAHVGIAHLPTSNAIHKSGVFPYWKFREFGGFDRIALGTDSVVSKNRLDLLTEAYQTRITHLYSRTIKYGSLFKMMTVNGANVLGMHDRGRIIPGMRADLVFWKLRDRGFIPYDESNPYTLLGNLIAHGGRTARDVMINGTFVIKDRKHLYVNESAVLDVTQKHHMLMRKRATSIAK